MRKSNGFLFISDMFKVCLDVFFSCFYFLEKIIFFVELYISWVDFSPEYFVCLGLEGKFLFFAFISFERTEFQMWWWWSLSCHWFRQPMKMKRSTLTESSFYVEKNECKQNKKQKLINLGKKTYS